MRLHVYMCLLAPSPAVLITRVPPVRMAEPASRAPDFTIHSALGLSGAGAQSKELLTFERMVRVKPYPPKCPYDDAELFGSAEPLRLQPKPSRTVATAVSRFYRRLLGTKTEDVLEHVCDGRSRLPASQRRKGSVLQLHASDASFKAGVASNPSFSHVPHSALDQRTLPDGLQITLPAAAGATR